MARPRRPNLANIGEDMKADRPAELVRPVDIKSFRLLDEVQKLRIRTKGGDLVQFKLWRNQLKVIAIIQAQIDAGEPVRLVILKYRQLGISTLVLAIVFSLSTKMPMYNAALMAHTSDSTSFIFRTAQMFYYFLPEGDKQSRPLVSGTPTKRAIEFSLPHGSQLMVATAGKQDPFRGSNFNALHASEVSYWRDGEYVWAGLRSAIGGGHITKNTAIIVEFTSAGRGNLGHRLWTQAHAPGAEFTPVFLSWKEDTDCRLELLPNEDFVLDEVEAEYQAKWELDLPQMKWARWCRTENCVGSWEKFHREYPISPDVAFSASEQTWFPQDVITQLLEEAPDPIFRGDIQFASRTQPVCKVTPAAGGFLWIWKYPEPGKRYIVSMDTGHGKNLDYHHLGVFEQETFEQVAEWRTNKGGDVDGYPPSRAGVKCYQIAAYYNWAFVIVERNDCGGTALAAMQIAPGNFPQMKLEYPRLYYRMRTDKRTQEQTKDLGFGTDHRTKYRALEKAAYGMQEERFRIVSKVTLLQLQGFLWNNEAGDWYETYEDPLSGLHNDDGCMMVALGYHAYLHLLHEGKTYCGGIKTESLT